MCLFTYVDFCFIDVCGCLWTVLGCVILWFLGCFSHGWLLCLFGYVLVEHIKFYGNC